jgi:hypothetical protein
MAQKTIVDFVGEGSENPIRCVLTIDYPALQVAAVF